MPVQLVAVVSAELLLLIVRAADVVILAKSASQRTAREQHRVDRGLFRGILLEAVVLVPASVTLLLLLSPWVIGRFVSKVPETYAALGLISYGFPFATVKIFVTRMALHTLKEFAALVPHQATDDER